ncbi:MAG: hypothetical protein OEZ34_14240 [Spirochaetia bacterium]|nr:hypothetical protein [Spirochaetia bacterium]
MGKPIQFYNSLKRNKLNAILSACFLFCAFLTSLFLFSHVKSPFFYAEQYYNSDTAYLHALYLDLFVDGYELSGWKLPPAPVFFPDMPLYFFSAYLMNDFKGSLALYTILNYFLFLFSAFVFYREVLSGGVLYDSIRAAALSVVSFTLITITDLNLGAFRMVYAPSFHGGAIWLSLFLLAVFIRLLSGRMRRALPETGFYILLFIGFLSDRMLAAIFLLPSAGVLLIDYFQTKRNRPIRIMAVSVVLYMAAVRIIQYLRGEKIIHAAQINLNIFKKHEYNFSDAANLISVERFINDFGIFLFVIMGLGYMALLSQVLFFFFKQKRVPAERTRRIYRLFSCAKNKKDYCHALEFAMILFAVLPPSAVFATFLLAGQRSNVPRYYNDLFVMSFIFIPLVLESIKRYSGSVFSIFISIFALFLFFASPDKRAKGISSERLAFCLDELSVKYNFQYGLSDYWNAKSVTLFSKNRLRIFQTHNMNMFYWVNNIDWYIREGGNYKFIVTDRMETNIIHDLFGPPDVIEKCGNSEVYIYNDNVRLKNYWSPKELHLWKAFTGN